MVKNNHNLVLRKFFLLKYQKLLTFLVKNPKKNCMFFAVFFFNMESPSLKGWIQVL